MIQLEEIKICGLSTREAVDAVINGGASHMGLIFFEKSPRNVTLEQAADLSKHAGEAIKKVAVTVDADTARLDRIVEEVQPDMLQLHGSETPHQVAEIKARYGLPVMKAIAVRELADLQSVQQYLDVTDRFLFDAKPGEGAELPGGNGVPFDWQIMKHLDINLPSMLSGGLNIANIKEAIALSDMMAIDVSSGVERAPGDKDTGLIRNFLAQLQLVEKGTRA